MTPDRYLKSYRPGSYSRTIESLVDFLEAVAAGEDLWNEGSRQCVTYSTMTDSGDYQALKALGWFAGADYGSYGDKVIFIYSPHHELDSSDDS